MQRCNFSTMKSPTFAFDRWIFHDEEYHEISQFSLSRPCHDLELVHRMEHSTGRRMLLCIYQYENCVCVSHVPPRALHLCMPGSGMNRLLSKLHANSLPFSIIFGPVSVDTLEGRQHSKYIFIYDKSRYGHVVAKMRDRNIQQLALILTT